MAGLIKRLLERAQGPVFCRLLFGLLAIAIAASRGTAANDVAGELTLFNNNGAWSWFEDERAIVDTAAGKIVVSSVAHTNGSGGAARHGDVEVAALDIASGDVSRFTLSNALQADDHNSAALWRRPDGKYLALYAKHGSDTLTRIRVSDNPGDISSWTAEQTFNNAAGTTYSNLHFLPNDSNGAGRLYNFTRTVGFDPNILISGDFGSSWSYGGRLLAEGTSSDRPYLRYFSDGDRIHFIATERHPRNFDNSIYHGYIESGQLFNSHGGVVDANLLDASAAAPADLTQVFATGTEFGGIPMRTAWTIDVAIDDTGLPYAVFQARANNSTADHRFFYARFNGTSWAVNELAKAGGFLYPAEDDYTGLAALDPHHPDRVFISTRIDPRDDALLAHYEIFEGVTADAGENWTWTPITFGSTFDNLRPIVPAWDDDHTALLWMRGKYTAYTNYDLNIVGLTEISPLTLTPTCDLDFDGDLDLDDFQLFLSGLHTDLSALSFDEAYRRGDLNGDRKNDFDDFVLFRDTYDAAHGAGALAAALRLPEPGSLTMLGISSALWISFRRRR